MDYRELLIRYMGHVIECEGFDYLSDNRRTPGGFADEEWAELVNISDALAREWDLRKGGNPDE